MKMRQRKQTFRPSDSDEFSYGTAKAYAALRAAAIRSSALMELERVMGIVAVEILKVMSEFNKALEADIERMKAERNGS